MITSSCLKNSKQSPKSTHCSQAYDQIRQKIHLVWKKEKQQTLRCKNCNTWQKRCKQKWKKTRIKWSLQAKAPQGRYRVFHRGCLMAKNRVLHSTNQVQNQQSQNWTRPKMRTVVSNLWASLMQLIIIQMAGTWLSMERSQPLKMEDSLLSKIRWISIRNASCVTMWAVRRL